MNCSHLTSKAAFTFSFLSFLHSDDVLSATPRTKSRAYSTAQCYYISSVDIFFSHGFCAVTRSGFLHQYPPSSSSRYPILSYLPCILTAPNLVVRHKIQRLPTLNSARVPFVTWPKSLGHCCQLAWPPPSPSQPPPLIFLEHDKSFLSQGTTSVTYTQYDL